MADPFGLKEGDMETIVAVLQKEVSVEQAVLFGSRAKGRSRNGSDVDIALKGKNLTDDAAARISFILNEETLLPYKFDVLNYHTIGNKELSERIDSEGVEFYTRRGSSAKPTESN